MTSIKDGYPQLPPLTKAKLLSLYEKTVFARLGTINEDGTPHITPIYFMYQDGHIIMVSQVLSRKIRNIQRNKKVSVLIDVTEPIYQGALIYGDVELDYTDVVQTRTEIYMKSGISQEEARLALNN